MADANHEVRNPLELHSVAVAVELGHHSPEAKRTEARPTARASHHVASKSGGLSKGLVTKHDRMQLHETMRTMQRYEKCRFMMESIFWQATVVLLVIIDLIVWVVGVSTANTKNTVEVNNSTSPSSQPEERYRSENVVSLIICTILCCEWCARFVIYPRYAFLKSPFTWIDFVAAFVSLVIESVTIHGAIGDDAAAQYGKLLLLARLSRFLRAGVLMYTKRRSVIMATRRLVSQNRRRFQDHEFDLDLTYVTDHLIAMSLPAHKATDRLYRNNIDDVSRFFRQRHAGRYMIYNVTSERRYDTANFEHCVRHLNIDDHNPAPLLQIEDVCNDVRAFLGQHPDNVASIHCKGGKGRTGTVICCALVAQNLRSTAQDALDYFAARRTDMARGSTYQGVQTPSQARYVRYYAEMNRSTPRGALVSNPPAYRIDRIVMLNFDFGSTTQPGAAEPSPSSRSGGFAFQVYDGMRSVQLGKDAGFTAADNPALANLQNVALSRDCLEFGLDDEPAIIIRGDVKCKIQAPIKLPGKRYDNCFLYFWFHTAFLDVGADADFSGVLRPHTPESVVFSLTRDSLDNGHHKKNKKVLAPNCEVQLYLTQIPASQCEAYSPKRWAPDSPRHGSEANELDNHIGAHV